MGAYKPSLEGTWDTTRKWLARGWLAVGLALSAVLLVRAMPHSPLRGSRPQTKPAAVADATVASVHAAAATVGTPTTRTETVYVRRLITRPIEMIRVGQRVLGSNPNPEEVEEYEEPDPATWRTIEVEQIKPSGKRLYATLLRPLEWIKEELDPESNTLELDLPELGPEGPARVVRIGPCRPIASGPGHIVTATFKHEPDGELLTVTIATHHASSALGTDGFTSAAGTEEIGCTANHPFWSEGRQAFVEAGRLRQGEHVRTRLDEVAAVVSIKPRPPTAWVYNLEVQGEHVYEVGPNGVLVHNSCQKDIALGLDPIYKDLAKQTNSVRWEYWFREGITRRGSPTLYDDVANKYVARNYKHFGRAFHHAAKRANKIHFALVGIDDPVTFAWEGRRGFVRDRYTAAELYIISRDKELLKKTIFYRNGQVVPNPFE